MIEATITILCALGMICIAYGFLRVLNAPFKSIKLKSRIGINELGQLEGEIQNLKEVIILADRIEEPTGDLYTSVKENFKKGVKYIFLISKSKYELEQASYLKIFQAIAETIEHDYEISDILEIRALNFEWDDYPYVFYRYNDPNTNSIKAFAYNGTQKLEGIADEYELINPSISIKMLNLTINGVMLLKEEKISLEEFESDDTPVIPIHGKAV